MRQANHDRSGRTGVLWVPGGHSFWTGFWLTLALLLPLMAAGLVAADGVARSVDDERALTRVQSLVGGYGLGAVTVPAWCDFAFDPRSDPLCRCPTWPLPGGPCFCPDHDGTVTGFVEDDAMPGVPRARPLHLAAGSPPHGTMTSAKDVR